jgi:AraC-like DNA-binding protein
LYGIVSDGHTAIVLGPVGYYHLDTRLLDEYSFLIGIMDKEKLNEHIEALKTIPIFPLEFVVNILCFLNYFVNGDKLTPVDVMVSESEQIQAETAIVTNALELQLGDDDKSSHNTYKFEQTMLKDLLKSSAPVGGTLSKDFMMQDKFIFINVVTLVARAAISGGLEPQVALQLADVYSQQCERLNSTDAIKNLLYRMVLDYTERVANLNLGQNPSEFVLSVVNFIQKNLTSNIQGKDIADHVHISRSAMCKKFKAETGQTVHEYLSHMRIEEAKRLLRSTNKTVSDIANYLCYSSQSHFQNAFKKAVGLTPVAYSL